jgi:hypothetical protein
MSTDSLIANIDYNTRMDRNINLSLNSNEGTIIPEDLSYAITINTSNEKLQLSNNKYYNKKYLIINILILLSTIIILCILYL